MVAETSGVASMDSRGSPPVVSLTESSDQFVVFEQVAVVENGCGLRSSKSDCGESRESLDDLLPPRTRRFTFGHADKPGVVNSEQQQQRQKRNSLPGKLMRNFDANGLTADWSSTKSNSSLHRSPSPRFKFRRPRHRSDSTSSTDSGRSSRSTDSARRSSHHGSSGVLHSLTHKLHDQAKKLFDKIRLAGEHECEVLETIVTTEEVRQVDFDHAKEVIDAFLEFGQVTATADPDENGQEFVLHSLALVSVASCCIPEIHEPDRDTSHESQGILGKVRPEYRRVASCNTAVYGVETVNQLTGCLDFSCNSANLQSAQHTTITTSVSA